MNIFMRIRISRKLKKIRDIFNQMYTEDRKECVRLFMKCLYLAQDEKVQEQLMDEFIERFDS